jgi:hypothetical protein
MVSAPREPHLLEAEDLSFQTATAVSLFVARVSYFMTQFMFNMNNKTFLLSNQTSAGSEMKP